MQYRLIILTLSFGIGLISYSQTDSVIIRVQQKMNKLPVIDTTDFGKSITLDPVYIYTPHTFTNKREEKRYKKLVYHIKKVYPYAKRAGEVLKEEEAKMASMGKSERKNHMKKVEKRIEDEFGKDIRNLTFTQGRILLKLIDRQTGFTSYELVDNLRGTFRAWFYDGIAGLFGYDLKGEYDPKNNTEDKYIEEIVYLIEIGKL